MQAKRPAAPKTLSFAPAARARIDDLHKARACIVKPLRRRCGQARDGVFECVRWLILPAATSQGHVGPPHVAPARCSSLQAGRIDPFDNVWCQCGSVRGQTRGRAGQWRSAAQGGRTHMRATAQVANPTVPTSSAPPPPRAAQRCPEAPLVHAVADVPELLRGSHHARARTLPLFASDTLPAFFLLGQWLRPPHWEKGRAY